MISRVATPTTANVNGSAGTCVWVKPSGATYTNLPSTDFQMTEPTKVVYSETRSAAHVDSKTMTNVSFSQLVLESVLCGIVTSSSTVAGGHRRWVSPRRWAHPCHVHEFCGASSKSCKSLRYPEHLFVQDTQVSFERWLSR